jgi:ABC-type transport system involved in multi-copper enzyme maturation permease subunit
MKTLQATLWVETLKIRKSRIFPATFFFFMFVSSMMGLIMFVQMYPGISARLGMIGDKASMLRFGEPNWQNYFRLLIEGMAGVGLVGIGFITSWVFGREFSDHTLKDIIALPVSRAYIVISKLILIVIWFALLSITYLLSGLLAGILIGLPGLSCEIIPKYVPTYLVTSLLSALLCTPVSFFASYSRGYIFPIGFVILTLILANFSGLVGLGPYFPWAIPGLYGTPAGSESMILNGASYVIIILTSLAGLFGTIAFWHYADQK